jgi:imidazole glycerol-phosphate synthase subunit HisH
VNGSDAAPNAAIVDYGLGNLYSVKHACEHVGLRPLVTSAWREIMAMPLVILPGVGAFGDAMDALRRLDLIAPLREIAASDQQLVGICLGMQLLMSESHEFGRHQGLGIVEGPVVRFANPVDVVGEGAERESRELKVPQVGWNRVYADPSTPAGGQGPPPERWARSPLAGQPNGAFMYFVHSFYAVPVDAEVVLATSRYGNVDFCSALQYRNVFATQFHPERSGPRGIEVYRQFAARLRSRAEHLETESV